MKATRRTGALALTTLAALGLAAAHPAHAQGFFNSNTGLAGAHATITLNSPTAPIANGARLTTQFADQGVTFTGGVAGSALSGMFYDSINATSGDAATGFSGAYAESYNQNNGNIPNGPFSIVFSGPVNAAAFAVADQGYAYTFDALLNGAVIDTSGPITVDGIPGDGFVGFRGETFDTIRVTRNTNLDTVFALDNIQYRAASTVPEPSTVAAFAFTALGAAALLLRARKRTIAA